jgi:hypothetical protein
MRGRGIIWRTVVAGDDPALALADFMAGYWNRQNQYMLISSLKGVFGGGHP